MNVQATENSDANNVVTQQVGAEPGLALEEFLALSPMHVPLDQTAAQ